MRLSKAQFKTLQQLWYQKLADTGFQDIEEFKNGELVLKQSYSHPLRHHTEHSAKDQEEYFRFMSMCIMDKNISFKNDIDKYVLTRHADGATIKAIVTELNNLGTPRARNSVRFIIRRYLLVWRLRFT